MSDSASKSSEGSRPPNCKRWAIFWPTYINAKKSPKEGRRIPQSKAVDNPSIPEIVEVLKSLQFPHVVEQKGYPRDYLDRWRVRVQLWDDNENPLVPELDSRRKLMYRLAELIPQTKMRQMMLARAQKAVAEASDKGSSSSQPSKADNPNDARAPAGRGGKEKGKGKKR